MTTSNEATLSNDQIIAAIGSMSVNQLVDLVKAVEDTFNVSAAAPVAMAMPVAGEAAKVEEQTEFAVHLTSFGATKVEVIKVVRAITGLGLKEAKDLVESAPSLIKEGIPKKDAEALKKQLEDAGASVEIK